MAERYERVFTLSENLYGDGSPIEVLAGVLLKDTRTNGVLAQLKYRSLADGKIRALRVRLQPYDVAGARLGDVVTGEYLDLAVSRDEEFGSRTPIRMPDASARSFAIVGVEVIYEDGTTWAGVTGAWATLAEQPTIKEWLPDGELRKQLRIEYGSQCIYRPDTIRDLWRCACGAVNHDGEDQCHSCGLALERLSSIRVEELESEKDSRLEAEKEAQEVERRERQRREEEQNALRRRRIRTAAIAGGIAAAVIAVALLVTQVIIPEQQLAQECSAAMALLDAGSYGEAAAKCEELVARGGQSNAVGELRSAAYDAAISLKESENYSDARELFSAVGDFENSSEEFDECRKAQSYQDALKAIDSADYESAYAGFVDAGSYADSSKYLEALVPVPKKATVTAASDDTDTYSFEYGDNALMTGVNYDGGAYVGTYTFSPDGVLQGCAYRPKEMLPNSAYSDDSVEYKSKDEIVVHTIDQDGKESWLTYYDEFGNYLTMALHGEKLHTHYMELDERHNPRNSHLKYDYDMAGKLKQVVCKHDDEVLTLDIDYDVVYCPDSKPDQDLMWRNFKIIADGNVFFDRGY